MKSFLSILFVFICFNLTDVNNASAGAFNFQEPVGWSVGDSDSTFQEWEASAAPFSTSGDSAPSAINTNPSISNTPLMNAELPGFVAGSGGYYAYTGNYAINANVFNHGGSSGSGSPYSVNHGTRVFVQTAATINDDPQTGGPNSIFIDSVELVQHDGSPIIGGDNDSLLQSTEVFQGIVPSSFGDVIQQELVFEFWLPGYTDDFRVQFGEIIHSSFQHLRIDSIILEESFPEESADFDNDGDVDGSDFLAWQTGFGIPDGTATPADGDANLDLNVNSLDFDIWKSQYGSATGAGSIATDAVPEPSSIAIVLLGLFAIARWDFRKP